jgi:hypothetical protein
MFIAELKQSFAAHNEKSAQQLECTEIKLYMMPDNLEFAF